MKVVIRSYIDTLYNYENDFDDKTKREFLSVVNEESKRLNKMLKSFLCAEEAQRNPRPIEIVKNNLAGA